MEKRTTLAVSAALVLSMLAGCSNADSTASGDDIVAAGDAAVAVADTAADSAVVGSVAAAATIEENTADHDNADDYVYDEAEAAAISLGDTITADSNSVDVDGTTATITAAGTYLVAGTVTEGQLIVDAGDDAVVQIVLDDATITNSDGAAIAVMSAEKAIVILADGSTNTLTDGTAYVLAEGETEPNAALYSAADLSISGDGSLMVFGNYNDGIASKDGLVIDSGDITVVAADDGIRGKDYVVVNDATLDITSGGDGIKADNDEDETKGYITITAGIVNLNVGGDAIQAATDVVITGGDFTISAGGGSSATVAVDDSAKAVKGAASVVIEGGTFSIDAADDAIHSNVSAVINDGLFEISTGDDAVHADETVEVNGGTLDVVRSYEGIEGTIVTINGGDISIIASDDGLNVAGGVDGSGTTNAVGATGQDTFRGPGGGGAVGGGPGGGAPVETPGEFYLYINGGLIYINAGGDGIDSNGYVTMNGGTVTIDGPTSGRDCSVDFNGSFEMNGGTLIGTTIDGMTSEAIDAGSQASMYLTTDSIIAAGTLIHIETSDGEGVVTFEASNSFSVIVFSSPDLVAGQEYNVFFEGTADGDDVYGLYGADAYSPGTLVGTAIAS